MLVPKIGIPFLNLNQPQSVNNQNYSNFGLKMSSPIQNDTVHFQAKYKPMEHALEKNAELELKRMNRIGKVFLDVLESIANSLKEYGVDFDRAYCTENVIKSPKSYVSKVVRSKSFDVPDRIRATLYCKNMYDLSILNDKILPELADREYIVRDIPVPIDELLKKGYIPSTNELKKGTAKIPDLDIRLDDVADQVTKLNPEYKYSISKSQASGYEDIQMRLVRAYDKKKEPVVHELIILFGDNYAKAKHDESEHIYKYARQFSEMNFLKSEQQSETMELAKRYVTLIKRFLSTELSQKSYENAKNVDVYGINDKIPIKVTPNSIKEFSILFDNLEAQMEKHYKDEIKNAGTDYVYKKALQNQRKEDRIRFAEIKKNLIKAIDFYNRQNKTEPKK